MIFILSRSARTATNLARVLGYTNQVQWCYLERSEQLRGAERNSTVLVDLNSDPDYPPDLYEALIERQCIVQGVKAWSP